MQDKRIMDEMLEKSRAAQKAIEAYTQEQVDELCRVIGRTVYDNAEELARMAVEETGMGLYEDKVKKIYIHKAFKALHAARSGNKKKEI